MCFLFDYAVGITSVHSLQFDFKTIEAATDKFAMSNKVGQGGFGQVNKVLFFFETQLLLNITLRTTKTRGN